MSVFSEVKYTILCTVRQILSVYSEVNYVCLQ